ncbi:L,D-transpeptidase family protein [Oceanicella sp. SM1341]|uniref:L,D-transpeptidase family protein n=1 Tax=Oceanicella sp. SM1341 TaxID=1548889 RepID=UPI000E47FBBF
MTDLVVGPWGARFLGRSFPCSVGRGGIGQKCCEGDGITPRGVWHLGEVMARPDRGGFAPGATPIGPRDLWSDDPADPAYNTAVRAPHPHSHEALRRPDGLYDLVGALDYNWPVAVAGAGSAIFLHVWRGPRKPTAGCVAFRRDDLGWILQRWSPRSRVIIR